MQNLYQQPPSQPDGWTLSTTQNSNSVNFIAKKELHCCGKTDIKNAKSQKIKRITFVAYHTPRS